MFILDQDPLGITCSSLFIAVMADLSLILSLFGNGSSSEDDADVIAAFLVSDCRARAAQRYLAAVAAVAAAGQPAGPGRMDKGKGKSKGKDNDKGKLD